METGLNRLVGTIVDTSLTSFHRYLLTELTEGWRITKLKVCAKWMFPQQTDLATYTIQSYFSHSLGWVAHGASPPPFGWSAPGDDSILAYDLFEPEGLERIFWVPTTNGLNIAVSTTKTIEFTGQLLCTESVDLYYLKDTNNQSSPLQSTTTIGWSLWYG